MALPVRVFLIAESAARADALQTALLPYPSVRVTGMYGRWKNLPYEHAVRQTPADVFVVDVPAPDPAYFRLARFHQDQIPGSETIFVTRTPDPGFEALARQMGVQMVLSEPVDYDQMVQLMLGAHERRMHELARRNQESFQSSRRGTIAAVMSAKDGEGKTTIAVNLATQLAARHNCRVMLVDLNTNFDDFTVLLNDRSPRHLVEVLGLVQGGAAWDDLHPGLATPAQIPNLSFLCGPCSIRPFGLDPTTLAAMLNLMAAECDFLVLDTPVILNEALQTALDLAHRYLVVVQNHVASLRNSRAWIQALARNHYSLTPLRIVLNRVSPTVGLSAADLESYTGPHPIVARLASAGREVIDALNRGIPFVLSHPDAPVTAEVGRLARHLLEVRQRVLQEELEER